jgi:hypothetical protein
MSYSKCKGKKNESNIANMIHDYFLENNSDYKMIFEKANNKNLRPCRSESSGAANNSFGDIDLNLVSNYFPYSIEAKDHAVLTDITIDSVLKGKIQVLLKMFTEQTVPNCNRAIAYHKSTLYPLLIFKGLRTSIMCLFNKDNFMLKDTLPENYVKYKDLIICKFEDFLNLH